MSKGKPTPKRDAQRKARRAEAIAERERDPNLKRLYEAFSPPPKSRRDRGNNRGNPTKATV